MNEELLNKASSIYDELKKAVIDEFGNENVRNFNTNFDLWSDYTKIGDGTYDGSRLLLSIAPKEYIRRLTGYIKTMRIRNIEAEITQIKKELGTTPSLEDYAEDFNTYLNDVDVVIKLDGGSLTSKKSDILKERSLNLYNQELEKWVDKNMMVQTSETRNDLIDYLENLENNLKTLLGENKNA